MVSTGDSDRPAAAARFAAYVHNGRKCWLSGRGQENWHFPLRIQIHGCLSDRRTALGLVGTGVRWGVAGDTGLWSSLFFICQWGRQDEIRGS